MFKDNNTDITAVAMKVATQFVRIHASFLMIIEKILNRLITKFYNSDDVDVIAAELRPTKTRPTSFSKKQSETLPTDVNKDLKTEC